MRGRERKSRSEDESVLHAAPLMDSPEPCLTEGGEKEGMTCPVGTEEHTVNDRRKKKMEREGLSDREDSEDECINIKLIRRCSAVRAADVGDSDQSQQQLNSITIT